MLNKHEKTLKEFVDYMGKHPEYRFFQGLRNFIQETVDKRWNYLWVGDNKTREDTFYWE